MLTNLALARVTVVEPLEEAVLVHELDAAAAGARVPEGVFLVSAVAADPAHVPLLLLVLVLRPRGGRARLLRQLALGGPVGDLRHGWLGCRRARSIA